MLEERKRRRKEARDEKKRSPTDLPQSPSKGKYQGKRKMNRSENNEGELKIEIDRGQSEHRDKQITEDHQKKLGEIDKPHKQSKEISEL